MSTLWIVIIVIALVLAGVVAALCMRRCMGKKKVTFGASEVLGFGLAEEPPSPCLGCCGEGEAEGGGKFRLKVSDPEYTALLEGKKTVEARPDRPPFSKLEKGDVVTVVRARPKGDTSEYPGGRYKVDAKIVGVAKHKDIAARLKKEAVGNVYPGKTAKEATERFSAFLPADITIADPVISLKLEILE